MGEILSKFDIPTPGLKEFNPESQGYSLSSPRPESYTNRMIDFTEPLPEADQAHMDSIKQEVK